jgi:hypothetical protein
LEGAGVAFRAEGPNAFGVEPALAFLVGPMTGHKWHPDSRKTSEELLAKWQTKRPAPAGVRRYVTFTPRFPKGAGAMILAMERTYSRAEVAREDSPRAMVVKTANVRLLNLPFAPNLKSLTLEIDGQTLPPPKPGETWWLEKSNGVWRNLGRPGDPPGKWTMACGPIDDAFRRSFVCVAPSSPGFHPKTSAAAIAQLARFRAEWRKWWRAELPVKTWNELEDADRLSKHLVLFGDPASNPEIAAALKDLPVAWTRDELSFGSRKFDGAEYLPALIYPKTNKHGYVVLNTGHTFHEAEYRGSNAQLYPRLGDFAVLPVDDIDKPALVGLFDDDWKLPAELHGDKK